MEYYVVIKDENKDWTKNFETLGRTKRRNIEALETCAAKFKGGAFKIANTCVAP